MRGRKRKIDATRRRDGRTADKPRLVQEAETKAMVIEARQRVYGLSKAKADDQHASTAVGRLYLAGELGAIKAKTKTHASLMVEAAHEYLRHRAAYHRAILASGVPSSGDLERVRGHDGSGGDDPRYVRRCDAAIRAYRDIRQGLLNAGPLVQFAVETWVAEDSEAWNLVGDLRLGLNVLVRLFRLEEREVEVA